jgi:predicted transglutaminase-like cysteine proteinase
MTVRIGTLSVVLVMMAAMPLAAARSHDESTHISVLKAAPRLAHFDFAGAPLAPAGDFAPWAGQEAQEAAADAALGDCLADPARCDGSDMSRFRRMMGVAAALPPREQLGLVHHYFNRITWTSENRDSWSSLVQTATTARGDCEDIAIAKYRALRRLGWSAENLRVLIGWDNEEKDWHAWLAARDGESIFVLDSILGLQRGSAYPHARVVYSVSELGVWDHAPDYVPPDRAAMRPSTEAVIPERAARLAATGHQPNKGVHK